MEQQVVSPSSNGSVEHTAPIIVEGPKTEPALSVEPTKPSPPVPKATQTPAERLITYLKSEVQKSETPELWFNISPMLKILANEKRTIGEIKSIIESMELSHQIVLPSHVYKLLGTIKSNGAQQTTYYSIDDINVYSKLP
jgi:hypothetical protein